MFVLLTFSHLLILRVCVLFPHCPCLSCSLFLTFLSLGCACFSPITHFVCAFPPLPMFVLLTFSSEKCMLFPHCPHLSCSLFLIFLSLGNCKTFHSFH
ncbi:hypothetical protein B0H14DRAFT_2875856 [Mycena olivaceomarginata]|nr:hypothetical protein B0H14DRAFT_2875856 [Mycena olivaceomarginata]